MPSYVAIKAIMPLMSQFLNTNKLQRLSFRSKQIISLFQVVVVFFFKGISGKKLAFHLFRCMKMESKTRIEEKSYMYID